MSEWSCVPKGAGPFAFLARKAALKRGGLLAAFAVCTARQPTVRVVVATCCLPATSSRHRDVRSDTATGVNERREVR
jgi:hypothetical protein